MKEITMRIWILGLIFCGLVLLSLAEEGNTPLVGAVKTGQQTVHARRDDGWYAKRGVGANRSFRNNNDGTIADLRIGLMWVADPSQCGGKFGLPGKPAAMTYAEAAKACEDLVFAGHDDWFLPTVSELQTTVDFGKVNPCVDASLFVCSSALYWAKAGQMQPPNQQWVVDFAGGFARLINPADRLFLVRPVRSDKSIAAPERFRYVDNGDGTISDESTGLMWVRDPKAAGLEKRYPWSQAIYRCEKLEYAGHKDWRLPNCNEILSIVDYSRFDPCIDTAFFEVGYVEGQSTKEEKVYWSSTTHAGNKNWAWALGSKAGFVDHGDKAIPLFIRPVRNMK